MCFTWKKWIKCSKMYNIEPTWGQQKGNFYLLLKEPFNKGFKGISWNFFEASHGIGAPDGVGGPLKDQLTKLSTMEEIFPTQRPCSTSWRRNFSWTFLCRRSCREEDAGPGHIKYTYITCLCKADEDVLGLYMLWAKTGEARMEDPSCNKDHII